jgi:hypothetical protein
MERSVIRERCASSIAVPDCAALHPGYIFALQAASIVPAARARPGFAQSPLARGKGSPPQKVCEGWRSAGRRIQPSAPCSRARYRPPAGGGAHAMCARLPALRRRLSATPVGHFRLSSGPGFLGRGLLRPVPVQQAPCRAVVMPPGAMPGAARVPGRQAEPAGAAPCPISERHR